MGDSYILPNLFSRELYRRKPDRVMILKRDERASVLVLQPPGTTQALAGLSTPKHP
jgi:hypothetical protein